MGFTSSQDSMVAGFCEKNVSCDCSTLKSEICGGVGVPGLVVCDIMASSALLIDDFCVIVKESDWSTACIDVGCVENAYDQGTLEAECEGERLEIGDDDKGEDDVDDELKD